MYYLDFKRQLDKHLNKSGTLTDPIATAIYTVKIRGPSEVVGSLEEAKARIAELESLLGQSQHELTGTQTELSMTQNELSMTKNKLSMTEAQLSAIEKQYSQATSTLQFLSRLDTNSSFH